MVNATAVFERRRSPVRLTFETVIGYRSTARPTPLVNPVGPCPGCPCSLSSCVSGGCGHGCCCPNSYSGGASCSVLSPLVGTVIETEVGA